MASAAWDERLLGDDPVDGSERAPDRLGRKTYADHLLTLLDRVKQQSESSVLALIGPWGSGKSSVLGMAIQKLRSQTSDDGWLVAEFNPWSYSDLESLQNGFFAELRAALPKKGQWKETRKRIGEFGQSVSPLGKLGGLVGADAEGALSYFSKLAMGDVSVGATKAKAEEALRATARPLLMVLDDLDRLDPRELLHVLKLVRQVGRLPHVYYMLCYDERTLLDVLMRTDLVGSAKESRARDYLEKIVQVRLDLPNLRDRQVAALLDDGLTAVLRRNGVQLGVEDEQRLQRGYSEHLRARLITPRSINRLLAQVEAFYGVVNGEVNFVDFFFITWLRTQEPGVYSLIQQYRSDLTGSSARWWRSTKADDHESTRATWKARLEGSGVSSEHVEGVMTVLGILFLPIKSAIENVDYGSAYFEELSMRQAVGHADYFDRYFAFGVPEEDLADSVVFEALEMIAAGESGAPVVRMTEQLREQPGRTIRKLRARRAEGYRNAIPQLRLLATEYGNLSEATDSFLYDPHWDADRFAYELLQDVDSADGPRVIRELASLGQGLRLAISLIRGAAKSSGQPNALPWFDDAVKTMLALVRERLAEVAELPLPSVPDSTFSLFWPWYEFDKAGASSWLSEQVDRGRWDLLEVLGRLVSSGTVSGGRTRRPALGELSLGVVEEVFGLDRVFHALSADIDGAERVADSWTLAPTPENRRAVALHTLRVERTKRGERSPGGQEENSGGEAAGDPRDGHDAVGVSQGEVRT